jgi:dUTP pyrophosphatase
MQLGKQSVKEDTSFLNEGSTIEYVVPASESYVKRMDSVQLYMEEGSEDLIPTQAHDDDAGYDLKANHDITLPAGEVTLVHTGVHICMRPRIKIDHYIGQVVVEYHMLADVRSRSGLALKQGLFVLNSPGTIDQSYKGEICVIMFNTKQEPYQVKRGDRIAQLVFLLKPIVRLHPVTKEEFERTATDTDRNAGAFGSTGR